MPQKISPLTAFYRREALRIIRDAKDKKTKPYAYRDLAADLENYGADISYQVLINRINRGSFSFALALQILAALGETQIQIKQPPSGIRKAPTRWVRNSSNDA